MSGRKRKQPKKGGKKAAKAPAAAAPAPAAAAYEGPVTLLVGTYGGSVHGLETELGELADGTFRTVFSVDAHERHVKVLAGSAAGFSASGGADGLIGLYDARSRKEFGQLYDHDGPVTAATFFGDTHLFTGGEDGRINVFTAGGGWQCQTQLKGHKGAVDSISVHPSGRLALSVGRDSSLRVWNMIRGNLALTKRLAKAACLVRWSARGTRYLIVSDSIQHSFVPECQLTCFNADGTVSRALLHPSRIVTACFLSDRVALVGLANGQIHAWDLGADTDEEARLGCLDGLHSGRVTGLEPATPVRTAPHAARGGAGLAAELPYVASTSADGCVRLWRLRARGQDEDDEEDEAAGVITAEVAATVKGDLRLTALATVGALPSKPLETAPAAAPAAPKGAKKGKKAAAKEAAAPAKKDKASSKAAADADRKKKRKKREQERVKASRAKKQRKDEIEIAPAVADGDDFKPAFVRAPAPQVSSAAAAAAAAVRAKKRGKRA